ncbi:hypothetical protein D3Z58_10205 [Clostridiaceae bacterium]|nr:hypothetical protein [Clostridiaceae bacterium]
MSLFLCSAKAAFISFSLILSDRNIGYLWLKCWVWTKEYSLSCASGVITRTKSVCGLWTA